MENSDFYIGQIFTEIYPPEASEWCNARGDCFISEIESEDGKRRFQITAIPKPTLEEVRASKLAELTRKFEEASLTAHCLSSLGFEIDANPTSNRDLEGVLLVLKPGEKTRFCDYYNEFHEVAREDIEIARREIVLNGQFLYAQKWALRDGINALSTVEELEAVEIEFVNRDFYSK